MKQFSDSQKLPKTSDRAWGGGYTCRVSVTCAVLRFAKVKQLRRVVDTRMVLVFMYSGSGDKKCWRAPKGVKVTVQHTLRSLARTTSLTGPVCWSFIGCATCTAHVEYIKVPRRLNRLEFYSRILLLFRYLRSLPLSSRVFRKA